MIFQRISNYINPLLRSGPSVISQIRYLWSKSVSTNSTFLECPLNTSLFGIQQIRTNVRVHFPRPSEHKRITRHGYKKRMSTPAGRRIIMRRILKGRYILSH